MDVLIFPNSARPGIGLKPRRESQRPLLPPHARHCPVLEAGSTLGYLGYPPLTPEESYSLEYRGDGRDQFVYYANPSGAKCRPACSATVALPFGGLGPSRERVRSL